MSASLVGSEMCIRDSQQHCRCQGAGRRGRRKSSGPPRGKVQGAPPAPTSCPGRASPTATP
eukprot:4503557-Alexandrium_andersonii.AAC.1